MSVLDWGKYDPRVLLLQVSKPLRFAVDLAYEDSKAVMAMHVHDELVVFKDVKDLEFEELLEQAKLSLTTAFRIPPEDLEEVSWDSLSQVLTEQEEEFEIVARTTTSTSRRRRTTTPGRATLSGPATKSDPIYTWGMQSSKPRNGGEYIQYEVRLNDDGSVTCNCPGWIFKKKTETRGCKHTRHEQIVKDAPEFYKMHQRGEQLPTIMPTDEQMERALNTRAGKKAAGAGKDALQGFGRFIELED